jgi:hypothetical protein
MNQLLLATPIDFLQQVRLSPGTKLEIVPTPDGLNRLDVISKGKSVATFTFPSLPTAIALPQRLCAANAPTLDSPTGRVDQWWDDDLLDETLEPLADFE